MNILLPKLLLLILTTRSYGQSPYPELSQNLDHVWMLIAGVLVFFYVGRFCPTGSWYHKGQKLYKRDHEELHQYMFWKLSILGSRFWINVWNKLFGMDRHR